MFEIPFTHSQQIEAVQALPSVDQPDSPMNPHQQQQQQLNEMSMKVMVGMPHDYDPLYGYALGCGAPPASARPASRVDAAVANVLEQQEQQQLATLTAFSVSAAPGGGGAISPMDYTSVAGRVNKKSMIR